MAGTRPIITAKINGEEARFILDSGAFWSVLSAAAAEQFKLRTRALFGVTFTGVGGATSASFATVKKFNLAGVELSNIEFLVGGSEVGSGAVGVLGQNFLERFDVEYDLANGMIRLLRDIDCSHVILAYWLKPDQPYSVLEISTTTPKEPHTSASVYINGVKTHVYFDTGAWASVLSLKAAARAGVKLDSPGVTDIGYTSGFGPNMVKSYIATFSSLKFGDEGEEIQHARLRMADLDLPTDMLIGSDFFLSHRVFVANSQHRLYFTYNGGPVFNLSAQRPAGVQATSPTPLAEPPDPSASPSPPSAAESAVAAAVDAKKPGEPVDAAALARRGSAYAGRQDYEPALADLNRAIEIEPSNAEYLYERGRVYWSKRDGDAALADFDRALKLQPEHLLARMSRAEFRAARKDFPGAKADLDFIDGIAAKSSNIRFEMARLYASSELLEAAIAQYDLWIPSHSEDSSLGTALNRRCFNRALLGQDLTKALADCNKAVKLTPKGAQAPALDSRGLVQLRLGDYDKAIADYNASLQLRPGNATSLYGRGLAKLKKNETAESSVDIAAAEKITPNVSEYFKRYGIGP
jgi:tetratricopeptide (TPR) repeat protein/predicted aspartyl protease